MTEPIEIGFHAPSDPPDWHLADVQPMVRPTRGYIPVCELPQFAGICQKNTDGTCPICDWPELKRD